MQSGLYTGTTKDTTNLLLHGNTGMTNSTYVVTVEKSSKRTISLLVVRPAQIAYCSSLTFCLLPLVCSASRIRKYHHHYIHFQRLSTFRVQLNIHYNSAALITFSDNIDK